MLNYSQCVCHDDKLFSRFPEPRLVVIWIPDGKNKYSQIVYTYFLMRIHKIITCWCSHLVEFFPRHICPWTVLARHGVHLDWWCDRDESYRSHLLNPPPVQIYQNNQDICFKGTLCTTGLLIHKLLRNSLIAMWNLFSVKLVMESIL